jgi:hypothetical protein
MATTSHVLDLANLYSVYGVIRTDRNDPSRGMLLRAIEYQGAQA